MRRLLLVFRLAWGTFLYYLFLILVQFLLLKKNFQTVQLLQVFTSFLTSFFIQFYDTILPQPDGLVWRVLGVFLGVLLTGIGASITVVMQLIPNPADALANTIGFVLKKSFGFGKNLLDLVCISLAVLVGLTFGRGLLGVGIGTLIAMILTGRVVAWCHPFSENCTINMWLNHKTVLLFQRIVMVLWLSFLYTRINKRNEVIRCRK